MFNYFYAGGDVKLASAERQRRTCEVYLEVLVIEVMFSAESQRRLECVNCNKFAGIFVNPHECTYYALAGSYIDQTVRLVRDDLQQFIEEWVGPSNFGYVFHLKVHRDFAIYYFAKRSL